MLLAGIGFWWLFVGFIDSGLWKICARVPNAEQATGFEDIDEDIVNEDK